MGNLKILPLLNKRVELEKCPILFKYSPDEDFEKYWKVMRGSWKYEDGWLIGAHRENSGGILFSREEFDGDVIFSFTAKTVLPATRDVNGLFCAHWEEETDTLGNAYVVGFNGWYDEKSGIERSPETLVRALTGAYKYVPGSEIRVTTGIIQGHTFLFADDIFVEELIDPDYIMGGHVGFSPYCTKLAVKDIEVRRAVYEKLDQFYEPEF